MTILFLGYSDNIIIDFLVQKRYNVKVIQKKINLAFVQKINPDIIISYGYTYIIKSDIIENYKHKIINLHISYLPWNRGSHPNFWSFIENTRKGVTIHYIDEHIDTGDILLQKEVFFDIENETLKSSYYKLRELVERLFIDNIDELLHGNIQPKKQIGKGTYHQSSDLKKYDWIFNENAGWDIKIKDLLQLINEKKES